MGYSRPMKRPTLAWGAAALVAVGLTAAVQTAGRAQGTGMIRGVVTMADPPPPATLAVNADQAVCGDRVPDETVVADAAGRVANAVVRLTGVPWPAERPAPRIDNAGCLFVPRVQIAPTRSQVLVTSRDDTLHSTHTYDDRNRTGFNIAMPFPGLEVRRPLRRPGVVRIECDSHGWMRGWIVVSDDRGAVSGLDGVFVLDDVPAGTLELTVWHERLRAAPQTVAVRAGETAEVAIVLEQP